MLPSAKRNSTIDKATCNLISLLFNIASSQDMLFHQLQQLYAVLATFALLCMSLLFPLQYKCQFAVYAFHGLLHNLLVAEVFLTHYFYAWNSIL